MRPKRSCAAPSTGRASTRRRTSSSSATRRASGPSSDGAAAARTSASCRRPSRWPWTSSPRRPCGASATPASTSACASSAKARPMPSSPPDTPAPGVASAILYLGRLPGVDRPALAVQMVTDRGPFVLLDIGATTDSTGMNLAQYAPHGLASSPSGSWASTEPDASRCSPSARRAARASSASRRPPTLLEGQPRPALHRQRRGQGPAAPPGRRRRLRRVGRQRRRSSSSRASRALIFDHAAHRVPAPPVGAHRLLLHAARHRPHPRRFDYERLGGAPLLGVNGTVLITHGRAKRRMIGFAVEVGATAARARHPASASPRRIAAAPTVDGRLRHPWHRSPRRPLTRRPRSRRATTSDARASSGHAAAARRPAAGPRSRSSRPTSDSAPRRRALERRIAEKAPIANAAESRPAPRRRGGLAPRRDRRADRAESAPTYPVIQLARIDRALLRSGMGELLHCPRRRPGSPSRSGSRLARTYSGEPARRLLNGVLGRVANDDMPGCPRADAPAPPDDSETRAADEPPPEEGASSDRFDLRATQEDRRGAARRRRGRRQARGVLRGRPERGFARPRRARS